MVMTTDREGNALVVRPPAVLGTLAIFSDPWSFAILMESYFGVRRFDDFQHNLQISRNVLTKRLATLVDEDILRRELYQSRPDRYEYRLTPKGRALYPIFLAMQRWGEEWTPAGRPQGWRLVHTSCGQETRPRMACDVCSLPVQVSDVRVTPVQGADDA